LAADNQDAKSNTRDGGIGLCRPSVLFHWHDSAGEEDAGIRMTIRGCIVFRFAFRRLHLGMSKLAMENGIDECEVVCVMRMNALVEEAIL
jgi:hypothetical protein